MIQKYGKLKAHYNRFLSKCKWLKTEKEPELGSSLQNQTKTEFERFVVTYTNISSSFIMISIEKVKYAFFNMH